MQRLTSHLTATTPAGGWFGRASSELAARWRSPLFRKYAGLLFTMLAGLLIANAAIQMYYAWRESRAAISAVQREKAHGAAAVIEQFLREIEGQVGWTTHANVLSGATGIDQRRFDFLRLLRQAPAVTELTHIDANGREQLKVSRLAMDVTGSGADYTRDPRFVAAKAQRRHVSAVYFRKESEPYLTLSIAGQGRNAGVTIAEVNLKFIWDVISRIEVGKAGVAYVVDQGGLLIAHPDIGLVLRKTDMSGLAHVAAARARLKDPRALLPETGRDRNGQDVLTASAPMSSLGWLIMVDQPLAEALTPVRGTLNRSLVVLLGGLTLAVLGGLWMARRMAVPINALAAGAERMGAGDLDHRIEVKTGDEVERLGQAFNNMGARLKESYAGLERKVEERTKELAESLEYQTAISEVLKVISSSPNELGPVFETIVRTARRLCDAERATIQQHTADGRYAHVATDGPAPYDESAEPLNAPVPVDRASMVGRVVLARGPVQILDAQAEPEFTYLRHLPNDRRRSMFGVPLINEGKVVGTITLIRTEVRPFTEQQVALVSTFADQAVIAIENARLFEAEQIRTKELAEALKQQTATADVLKTISRSAFDIDKVLTTLAETSARLCDADMALIRKRDGDAFRPAATFGWKPEWRDLLEGLPVTPARGLVFGRVVAAGKSVQIPDMLADAEYDHRDYIDRTGARAVLGVPMYRNGSLLGTFTLHRQRAGAFTPEQVALVETFADQAVIAIENARLFEAEQTRTKELAESLEYQTAISSVLGVISRSPSNLKPVLDTIAHSSSQLCNASDAALLMVRDKRLKAMAHHGPFALADDRPLEDGTIGGRAIMTREAVHVHDVASAGDDFPKSSALAALSGARTVLAVPMICEGDAIGCIMVRRDEVKPFTDRQIALVVTFANQAVIAIENARLFEAEQTRTRELQESLKQQTATADVLKAISRSTFDLQKVLDTLSISVAELCEADISIIRRRNGDVYPLAASHGLNPEQRAHMASYSPTADRGSAFGRSVLDMRTEHVPDVLADPSISLSRPQVTQLVGIRSVLSLPLVREGQIIGALSLMRREPKPFSAKHVELSETFADQAVIAIENARLFEAEQTRTRELTESLEFQTATAEVLGVISKSPNELQPVLQAITETASRLCDSEFAALFNIVGDKCLIAAGNNARAEFIEYLRESPVPIEPGSAVGRAAFERKTFHIEDVLTLPGYTRSASQKVGGQRTVLTVPLLRDSEAIGVIALMRSRVKAFTEKQIKLVETFADQAVIAMNNARLFEELQESLEYQTATSEVLGVISRSPNELQPVLDAIATTAVKLCAPSQSIILLERAGELHLVASHHYDLTSAGTRLTKGPIDRGWTAGRAFIDGTPVHVPDLLAVPEEFPLGYEIAKRAGHRTTLGIPLMRHGKALGCLFLRRAEVRPFTERQIALLQTFADQAVIAINNVGLFEEVQARTRELQAALKQQTATADVLKTISRSAFDLQRVLDTLASSAASLCEAPLVAIHLPKGLGLKGVARYGFTDEIIERLEATTQVHGRGSLGGRTLSERKTVHIADVAADAEYTFHEFVDCTGARSMLGVPLLRDGQPIGLFALYRRHVSPFTDRQIELMETFADQAVIAINNVGLFEEVQARTKEVEARSAELAESLEYQTAISDVLGVISRSPNELQPILDTITAIAERLCSSDRGQIFVERNGKYHLAAHRNTSQEFLDYLANRPFLPGHNSSTGRALSQGRTIHVADVQADPTYDRTQMGSPGGARLSVPLLRHGRAIGVITVARNEPVAFTERQIGLISTFADQAVIAIENTRLFEAEKTRTKELTESLELQTASASVLEVISSSPTERMPVLQTIADTAARMCETSIVQIFLLEDGAFRQRITHGVQAAYREIESAVRLYPGRDSLVGRVALTGKTQHIHDCMTDSEYAFKDDATVGGLRTMLGVPLVRRGEVVGVITLARMEVHPFTARQVEIVTDFARQAVIAINNAHLFEAEQTRTKELTESLDYQTATSEVLGVISRSKSNVQPVFEAIVNSAAKLFDPWSATVTTLKDGQLHWHASASARPEHATALRFTQSVYPIPFDVDCAPSARAMMERRVVELADAAAPETPGYSAQVNAATGLRSMTFVPLVREDQGIGTMILAHPKPGLQLTGKQRALVQTFADQAVIAIENARLLDELQTRQQELARSVEELQSLGAVSRTVSATLDMSQVLETVLENACRMAYAGGGTIYVYDKETGEFRLEAGHNMSDTHIQRVREQPIRMGDAIVGECGSRREVVQIADLQAPEAPRTPLVGILIRDGVRAILSVPLLHQGEVIGALVIRRTFPGAFSPDIVRLLEAFAAQSAIAVNNARLFKDIEEKGRQLELASQHKSQFLANMSHELRTPLNAILGYTELLTDGTYGELAERPKGVLQRIDRNGKHLLGLINDVLDLSKIEAGEMQLALEDYALGSLVQNTITVTEPLARQKGLELKASVPPDLPLGRGDARRLSQVLLNLVGNAIKFTDSGRIDVTARLEGNHFRIAVKDTGPGIPPAEQDKIFEKFQQVDNTSTRRKGGSGLGLSISKELVEMHGGTIAVSSTVGQGSTFEVCLPRRVCSMKEAS